MTQKRIELVENGRRVSMRYAAFDCVIEPCGENGCGTNPGSNHGRHGEEWHYTVRSADGLAAANLVVYTRRFLACTPAWIVNDRRPPAEGMHLTLHVAYRCEGDDDYLYDGSGKDSCEYLGRPCEHVLGTSLFGTRDFFVKHGNPNAFEQSEPFWEALEARLVELDAELRSTALISEAVIADRQKKADWLVWAKESIKRGVSLAGLLHDARLEEIVRWIEGTRP